MSFIKEFWEFLRVRKKYWLLPIIIVLVLGLLNSKILGKDLLNLKYNNHKTYWIEKTGPKSKMKNQF